MFNSVYCHFNLLYPVREVTVNVTVKHFITARNSTKIEYIEAYLKANRMYRNYDDPTEDPVYSEMSNCYYGDNGILCFTVNLFVSMTT